MANPGPYPQMGPPMGGPMQPMGPPMGPMGMQPRRPVRQGTSRVVPVVVSAGLAMGVFCGLLFGLGTGKRSASAEPPKSNGVKRVDDSFTPESMANPNVKIPDKNAPRAGSNAGVAATPGSGSGSAATAAAGSAGSAEPAIKPTKLIVEIKPEAAASTAKVFVDGKPIEGTTTDITPDPGTTKKKVKVLVKAPSYKDVEQEIEIEGDSTTLKLEFTKTGRATGQAATEGGTGATAGSSTTATSGTTGGTTGASGGAVGHSGGSSGNNGNSGNSGNSGNTGAAGNGGGGNGGGGNGGGKATGGGKGSGGKGKGKGSGGLIDI